ncbi:MAG: class I SAM-dependent methyltransferase [Burkholderiaceae bacterium]|nr:class I SAM-dependent methyltransferase [Burkholderiaceae bacterium]
MDPADYDAWYETPRGRWIGEREWRLVCRGLDMRPRTSLLDVGCGTGWFSRKFARAGLAVTGLDLDRAALAFAREHSPGNIAFIEGDARRLPFADGAFDQTVALASLCFVDDWPLAIAEIARVTRRRFVLGLLNRHSLLWREKKGRNGGRGAYRGAHWHTPDELRPALGALPLTAWRLRSAIFLPSGGIFSRAIERVLPPQLLLGAFLVASAEMPG